MSIIENYNKSVVERIEKVSKKLDIPIKKFKPKDVYGKEHTLRIV